MLDKLKERKGEGGFTLIELLIVIIILAILAAIVIFAVGTTTKNAAVASCHSTVKTVETALEAYSAQHTGSFPAATGWTTLTAKTATTGNGPWLRAKPAANTNYTISLAATGKVHVTVKGTTKTADAATDICSTA